MPKPFPACARRRPGLPALVSALLCLAAWLLPAAPKPGAGEYTIKATYLFHFTQFIEWPAGAFASNSAPFVVGVVGKDPFGSNLADALKGEKVRGHPVQLKSVSESDDLKGCHILFIAASEKERVGGLLAKLKGAPVLTVSETDRFGQRGGLVNFYKEGSEVKFDIKFDINLKALKAAGLSANSQLLRLARIVESDAKD